ncbi:MAG: hypothetical protein HYZ42_16315, partial [Bacteroidetes bacterium]|nr:hypothetical protein [Bacteroidota bacterium]
MNRLIVMGNTSQDDQYYQYLRMLNFLIKKGDMELFQKWHRYFDKMMAGDYVNFQKFMTFSQDFFIDLCLTQTEVRRWKHNSIEYEFIYDKFPIIKFKSTDIGCYTEGDTMFIQGTSGVYLPYTKQWTGVNGKVNWARCGYDPDQIYAKFKYYSINMNKGEYKVDTVTYSNLQFFGKPLQGSFEDKVTIAKGDEHSTYPRFLSFEKNIYVKNLIKDVDIQGGFWHKGGKVLANGSDTIKTKLIFRYKGEVRAIAKANTFAIDDTRLVSDKAEISFYLKDSIGKTDSIYHPQIALNFPFADKVLSAVRNKEGISQTPFMDSYHKMEINCDVLNWQTNLPIFELKMINPDAPAVFE